MRRARCVGNGDPTNPTRRTSWRDRLPEARRGGRRVRRRASSGGVAGGAGAPDGRPTVDHELQAAGSRVGVARRAGRGSCSDHAVARVEVGVACRCAAALAARPSSVPEPGLARRGARRCPSSSVGREGRRRRRARRACGGCRRAPSARRLGGRVGRRRRRAAGGWCPSARGAGSRPSGPSDPGLLRPRSAAGGVRRRRATRGGRSGPPARPPGPATGRAVAGVVRMDPSSGDGIGGSPLTSAAASRDHEAHHRTLTDGRPGTTRSGRPGGPATGRSRPAGR